MKPQGWELIYPSKKVVDRKHPEDLTELAGLIYEDRLDLLTSQRLSDNNNGSLRVRHLYILKRV